MNLNLTRALAATLAAASLALSSNAQTIGCVPGGTGGPFPSTGTGGGGVYPNTLPTAPGIFTLNVATLPPGSTVVTEVKLNGVSHTYLGDLQFVLTDPGGAQHNLMAQPSGGCDFGGNYSITSTCTGAQPFPNTCTVLTPGPYDQYFGNWPSGSAGVNNTPINSIAAATGLWTLTAYDWYGGDVGFLTSWEVCFGTPTPPSAPSGTPTLSSPPNGSTVLAPVTLNWNLVACATSYDVDVDGSVTTGINGLSYQITAPLAVGLHNWSVRAVNVSGAGPWAAVNTFDIPSPPPASSCVANGTFSGPVPTTGTGGGGVYPTSFPPNEYTSSYSVTVPPGATQLVRLVVDFTVEHTFLADLQFVLKDPSGISHNIVCRPSTSCDLNGLYSIYETAGLGWTSLCVGGDIPPGDYDQDFGSWPSGTSNVFNTPLSQIPVASGNWTLTVYDWAGGDVGTIGDWYVCFNAGGTSSTYCTAGTSTNGCVPAISATGSPSVSAASGFTISVANVEGQKSGLLFYGISGRTALPWAAGSNSFLCVKAPTQRMTFQSSGGTIGGCDGTLTQDWLAWAAANPAALGQPFAAGNVLDAQGWYRDPQAVKTTNLSDGLEFVLLP